MADPVEYLGPFAGSELSRQTADERTIALIPHELLAPEVQLFTKKWYDYRRLHPMVATYYFVSCYSEAYRQAMVKAFDCERGQYRKGVKGDFLDKKERLSFWRLRQMADGMGMPYPVFLRACMSHYLDDTGWLHVPRPSHLGSGTATVAAYEEWNDLCRHRLQIPADPFYRADAYIGHPYQDECEAWLLEQAQRRENPRFAVAALVDTYKTVRACALDGLPERLQEEVARERGSAATISQG